ncbi:tumor necrosis factor alpha-induced protein 2 isoform X2 [Acanthochromis polyacanthus]|uniref:Tumor necrosis factor, alpha-induced protein 2b n=2 Tax=Acanthochromis polyacanthus TaxID=80966 RepID=A0A3Q1GY95_9TELE|nr:tumor necrosis factor alpha-induced protein 2 isoform X2 [Acanthochromis polyacanthus]
MRMRMRMRSPSNSSDAGGTSPNLLQEQSSRSTGQGWLRGRFPKLFRSQAGLASPAGVGGSAATDGRQIVHVEEPPVVIPTFEQNLEDRNLREAAQLLIEQERHLFGEITESVSLKCHEEEVKKLATDREALEKLVFQTLEGSLEVNDDNMAAALRSAVEAIQLEEQQDQLWRQNQKTFPPWRPSGWRKRHDLMLRRLVENRLDNEEDQKTPDNQVSALQADVQGMGRQLKEDLLLVVKVLNNCYPPDMDVCNLYARMFHQSFSARLRKIAEYGLEDKDGTFLLLWVNKYYPGILQKPELVNEIDAEALGKLLPEDLLEPLEEQFLSNQQSELKTNLDNVLKEEKEKWTNGEEPSREDDCYISTVAYDVIVLLNGRMTSTQTILGDQQKAQSITDQLKDFMQRYKVFQEDVIKQNRANSKALVKATLHSIQQFSDVLVRKKLLLPEDVRESCLCVLTDMRQSAHAYLLNPVHKVLKPHYQKLGTSDWLKKNPFEKLLSSIEKELEDLQGSSLLCNQELMGQLHQEVTVEYVRRLLKGDVKLKDREKQQNAYLTVKDNAESLHKLFSSKGSQEEWLKEILIKIAEVLQLQDVPAIQMQIISLGSAYPDLSEKQVSALLKLKTNLSKADRKTVKATLVDTLNATGADLNTRPFFCRIEIR